MFIIIIAVTVALCATSRAAGKASLAAAETPQQHDASDAVVSRGEWIMNKSNMPEVPK